MVSEKNKHYKKEEEAAGGLKVAEAEEKKQILMDMQLTPDCSQSVKMSGKKLQSSLVDEQWKSQLTATDR